MCTFFFSWKKHPVCPFVLAANRDEAYERPYRPLHCWDEHPHILAGQDLRKGGTWLGINKGGYAAALTNYRVPFTHAGDAKSRGVLVKEFLQADCDPKAYLERVKAEDTPYKPFNLLLFSLHRAWYYNSVAREIISLPSGNYALSNACLDTPWFKVIRGKKRFEALLNRKKITKKALLSLMQDETPAPPYEKLPNTGLSPERERAYSSLFIKTEGYGTRATCLIIRRKGSMEIMEKTYNRQPTWHRESLVLSASCLE